MKFTIFLKDYKYLPNQNFKNPVFEISCPTCDEVLHTINKPYELIEYIGREVECHLCGTRFRHLS